METRVAIGIPILLMLAMLLLFGVTWLFHHHHWRPFAGVFLFVIGLGFFLFLARSESSKDVRETSHAATTWTGRITPSIRTVPESAVHGEAPLPTSPAPLSPTPEPRPDWVDRPPHVEPHDDGSRVYVATAASGRYATPAECERAIIAVVNDIVAQYVTDYIPENAGQDVALDADYIRSQWVKEWYWEPVNASVGPMNQLHARLVFDHQVHDELARRARETLIAGRLKYTAAGTALALLLLGGVYSLLNRGTPRATS